jgi:hypothetical protein
MKQSGFTKSKKDVPQMTARRVDEERIRVRAYELFEKRNGGPGDAVSDWCAAEAELNAEKTH